MKVVIGVDEHTAAEAIGVSVYFLQKDRRTRRLIPYYRLGDRILYDLDRVRATLLTYEEGGVLPRAVKRKKGT